MPQRELRLTRLDQILPEVDRLNQRGYAANGKWDLAQVCEHLADWMSFPINGYPRISPPMSWILSLLCYFRGKKMVAKILQSGKMQSNAPTLPATVHGPGSSSNDAVERLRAEVDRLERHQGPFYPSPLFGELTRDEHVALQLVHCSHHLSFLEPKA